MYKSARNSPPYDWDKLSGGGTDFANLADEDEEDEGDKDDEEDSDEDSDHPTATGRISGDNVAIVQEGFLDVMQLAKTVSLKTGLSTSQVFKQWSSINRRKHVRSNLWNLYAKYFKDHEKQELGRLSTRKF